MTGSAGDLVSAAHDSDIVEEIARSRRRAQGASRVTFTLTWVVLVGILVGTLLLAGKIDGAFIAKWAPYILGGVPITGGFLGKWLVFSVLVKADMLGVAVLGALLSVVALAYYLRVVVALWMQAPPEGEAPPFTVRFSAGLATAACAVAVLALGVFPGWYFRWLT